MAWIMDTYSQQKGHAVPGVVTGKADRDRGFLGAPRVDGARRHHLRGRGGRRHLGLGGKRRAGRRPGLTAGGWLTRSAPLAAELGARVVAVRTPKGGVHDPDTGLDLATRRSVDLRARNSRELPGSADRVTNAEILELPVRGPDPGRDPEPARRRARTPSASTVVDRRRGRKRTDDPRGGRDPRASEASSWCPTSWPTPAA